MQDFREFGVERRGETQAALEAVAARRPAQRAFGGDVDGFRPEGVELFGQPAFGRTARSMPAYPGKAVS
jgi:hypothetical protein